MPSRLTNSDFQNKMNMTMVKMILRRKGGQPWTLAVVAAHPADKTTRTRAWVPVRKHRPDVFRSYLFL